jgi:hypothetical protein
MKLCCICKRPITYTFWVCADCEKSYGIDGVRYADWPDWIKLLVRTDRRQRTIDSKEIVFSSLGNSGFDPFDLS